MTYRCHEDEICLPLNVGYQGGCDHDNREHLQKMSACLRREREIAVALTQTQLFMTAMAVPFPRT
jgi:hypothetical protein